MGHILERTESFDAFCIKVGSLGSRRLKEPSPKNEKTAQTKGCTKSHMRRNETPYLICIKFCVVVNIPDVITHANFGYNRLRGFWVARVKFPPSP